MAQIPATVHGLTGVDIREVIKKKAAAVGTPGMSQADLQAIAAAKATAFASHEPDYAAGAKPVRP